MTKTSNTLCTRRLLASASVIALFILYLLFDIDYLIAFDIENNATESVISTVPINTTILNRRQRQTNENLSYQPKQNEEELKSKFDRYGFDKERWHQLKLTPRHCPYFENICVHRQHFYVFDEQNAFKLYPNSTIADIFGFRTQNAQESLDIFKKVFNTRVWNQTTNEYESSHCILDSTPNHMILSGIYLSMMGEFYLRILTALHWIFNEEQLMDINNTNNIKMYLMLPEFTEILLSHRVFLELFTQNEVLSFVNLFEHYRCKCYQRLFFCGFHKLTSNGLYLKPKEEPFKGANAFMGINKLSLFNKMIDKYQSFVNDKLGINNLKNDVLKWKQNELDHRFGTDMENASQWRFIGFYQRTKRRRWNNIRSSLRVCNKRYKPFRILCIEINLEGFLHSKDLIIMHRGLMMVVGIHGATLTDAVFMENGVGNYIIELLPHNGPDWTSSLDQPTLSGVLFWKSKFNYVGMKLGDKSVIGDGGMWYDQDFIVNADMLVEIIDFLIVDEGGYCEKFKRADMVQVPEGLEGNFAIYNAYCSQTPDIIHSFVKPRAIS